MKSKTKLDNARPWDNLWSLSCKLHGIGNLIAYYDGEPSLNQQEVSYGVGTLIIELADEVQNILEAIEKQKK